MGTHQSSCQPFRLLRSVQNCWGGNKWPFHFDQMRWQGGTYLERAIQIARFDIHKIFKKKRAPEGSESTPQLLRSKTSNKMHSFPQKQEEGIWKCGLFWTTGGRKQTAHALGTVTWGMANVGTTCVLGKKEAEVLIAREYRRWMVCRR